MGTYTRVIPCGEGGHRGFLPSTRGARCRVRPTHAGSAHNYIGAARGASRFGRGGPECRLPHLFPPGTSVSRARIPKPRTPKPRIRTVGSESDPGVFGRAEVRWKRERESRLGTLHERVRHGREERRAGRPGQGAGGQAGPRLPDRRGPPADRGRARRRQDHAGPVARPVDRLLVPPDPVHARPAAHATSPGSTSTTRSAATSSSSPARSSPTSCWPTRSTAPVPKTQSALLEAMEERQVTVDGVTLPARARPSWSSRPRTRSSTRAPTRCPRPSSTAS